jgi:hypothetical protein
MDNCDVQLGGGRVEIRFGYFKKNSYELGFFTKIRKDEHGNYFYVLDDGKEGGMYPDFIEFKTERVEIPYECVYVLEGILLSE